MLREICGETSCQQYVRQNVHPFDGGEARTRRSRRWVWTIALMVLTAAIHGGVARADEPFAPTREYALQNARIELRFDLDQRKIMGQVTHTVAALHEGLRQLDFDSAGLDISSVRVNGRDAHFSIDASKLHVNLERPSTAGEKYEIAIRYEGKPKKGIYFVWPDKSNSNQPKEIWTQGEAQDTRYYIPIYDYPNNRATIEMIVTVPRDWVTVSNGRLEGIADAGSGMKTWTWRQAEPISSYLISLVAGEFDEVRETWHNLPVDYYVPHGERERVAPTFAHTRDMLTYFSDRVGVPYPWAKYDQTMVDQFVEGGMENVSATTLTTRGLLHPVLARETLEGSDNLISHEMSHQWFGDLVTCKDWANLWLNEGFATFMAQIWEEHEYGADNAAYSRWRAQAGWLRQSRLYSVPVVNRDFNDSMKYAGNIYGKAGLILEMLREQLGDETFFHGLQHYLEVNRLGNVVTADLIKALEESSHTNLDRFFDEWIYGGGAPRFSVTSTYDAEAKLVRVQVKQSQEIRATVGLFEVPVTINVTTARGAKDFPVTISKADETFSFPAESQPLMVLFDKGDKILKTVDFQKSPAEWIYQLQHASDVPDRAEAAKALGDEKGNEAAAAALGEAALHDPFWGVRDESLLALGRIGSGDAEKGVIAALANSEPWVREQAVTQLGHFRDDSSLTSRLAQIFHDDPAYRVRAAALGALGQIKAPDARETLEAAAKIDSPDDVIRRAALRAMGLLGDDRSARTLLEWSSEGQPVRLRAVAIGSLARVDKKNADIESKLLAYLNDSSFDIRFAALSALGERGDPAAIGPLTALLNGNDMTSGLEPVIEEQLARLKNVAAVRGGEGSQGGAAAAPPANPPPNAPANQPSNPVPPNQRGGQQAGTQVVERLDRLERTLAEMNDRLKRIEQEMPPKSSQ
jgi:aminopeptidase N